MNTPGRFLEEHTHTWTQMQLQSAAHAILFFHPAILSVLRPTVDGTSIEYLNSELFLFVCELLGTFAVKSSFLFYTGPMPLTSRGRRSTAEA
jgi:hypothetical protein